MPDVGVIPFAVLAAAMLGGGVMMMLSRNVVHAAFWLLEVLVSTAGLYLLLQAEFLALVQIMVYAGAVSVLVLFVIMLTLRRREDAVRPRDLSGLVATMAVVFAVAVGAVVRALPAQAEVVWGTAKYPVKAPDVAAFGQALFSRWVLPFEIASGILLVALVGAVWWAGRGEEL